MRTVQNQTRKQVLRLVAMLWEELLNQLLYDPKCGWLEDGRTHETVQLVRRSTGLDYGYSDGA
jgi:hypothetical protein